jgi:hypothetical protein
MSRSKNHFLSLTLMKGGKVFVKVKVPREDAPEMIFSPQKSLLQRFLRRRAIHSPRERDPLALLLGHVFGISFSGGVALQGRGENSWRLL